MLKLFLCLAVLLPSVQLGSKAFYVEVEAHTKYDSRYIFNRSNRIIPQDRPVKESDIQSAIECLVDELKATGLFEDVNANLVSMRKEDVRKLEISTVYHRQIEGFVISEITLDGLQEVDKAQLQSALNEKGVKPGIYFLQYPFSELEEKISEALRAVYPDRSVRDKIEAPWITVRPDGERAVKLIVSQAYSGCGPSAK